MSNASLLRLAVFVVLVAHMQAGPLLRQVLHLETPPLGMAWQMYASPGRDVCAVQWLAARPEGYAPIDRFAVLGVSEPREMKGQTRHQRSAREVYQAAQELCARLPGVDVRARARCGVRRGLRWEEVIEPSRPLCAPQGRR